MRPEHLRRKRWAHPLRDAPLAAISLLCTCFVGVLLGDGFTMQNDILAPYLLELTDDEQKQRWLPPFTTGHLIAAIAMTEPGAGSDLQGMITTARRDGDSYVLNGTKTFVTSGIMADLVIVAARTSPEGGKDGFSLFAVERDTPGLSAAQAKKSGRWAQDTAELFFNDAVVPVENRLGEEGRGFRYLMANLPRERLSMAVSAVAAAEHALEITLVYVKERTAFGQAGGELPGQPLRARRAGDQDGGGAGLRRQLHRRARAARAHRGRGRRREGLDHRPSERGRRSLRPTPRRLWLHVRVRDSRLWRDARVQRIYGGTNEIMYEIVGRSLGPLVMASRSYSLAEPALRARCRAPGLRSSRRRPASCRQRQHVR